MELRPASGDAVSVRVAQEEAMWAPVDVAELLAGFTNSRGVQHRQHLGQVGFDEGVEEDCVGVVQRSQEDVSLEIIVEPVEFLAYPFRRARPISVVEIGSIGIIISLTLSVVVSFRQRFGSEGAGVGAESGECDPVDCSVELTVA